MFDIAVLWDYNDIVKNKGVPIFRDAFIFFNKHREEYLL